MEMRLREHFKSYKVRGFTDEKRFDVIVFKNFKIRMFFPLGDIGLAWWQLYQNSLWMNYYKVIWITLITQEESEELWVILHKNIDHFLYLQPDEPGEIYDDAEMGTDEPEEEFTQDELYTDAEPGEVYDAADVSPSPSPPPPLPPQVNITVYSALRRDTNTEVK